MKRKSEEHIKELHPVGNGFKTFCVTGFVYGPL